MKTPENIHNEKIILGMDPGTSVMGYGVLLVKGNKLNIIQYGVIHLSKYSTHELKLKKIFERVIVLFMISARMKWHLKLLFMEKMCNQCSSLAEPREWPWLQPCQKRYL